MFGRSHLGEIDTALLTTSKHYLNANNQNCLFLLPSTWIKLASKEAPWTYVVADRLGVTQVEKKCKVQG